MGASFKTYLQGWGDCFEVCALFCRFLLERDDMKFYQKSKEELLHSYDVKIDRGLSSTQVTDNRERYGENKLPEENK